MSYYLGIDPGASGAIAVLSQGGHMVAVHDMPAVEVKVGKTLRNRVSAAGLRDLLQQYDACTMCIIEKVGGMTGQSASAAFTFGFACALAEGVAVALGMPVAYITPQSWKKSAGIATDKGAAREAAMRLWPNQAKWFARKKDDGRAEAALIARHGWLQVPQHAREAA